MELSEIEEAFESPLELLDSAKKAERKFKRMLLLEYKKGKADFVSDPNMIKGLNVLRFSVSGAKPGIKLRKEGYNILSDCRHALDQMVVASTILLGGEKKDGVYFPFVRDAKDFDDQMANKKGRYQNVHPALIPTLREIQPWWENGDGTGDNALRTLGFLSGPNKHQVMIDFAPELVQFKSSRLELRASLHTWLPPVRADLATEPFGKLIRTPKGRTDFILAVTSSEPGEDRVDFDFADFAYCAVEAERFSKAPIHTLFAHFLERTSASVDRIKSFVVQQLIA